jgi:hypothetical protein
MRYVGKRRYGRNILRGQRRVSQFSPNSFTIKCKGIGTDEPKSELVPGGGPLDLVLSQDALDSHLAR